MDGARDLQLFWHIIIPEMRPALSVVVTTMLVNVLKIFDIIYVMTNGNYGTEVITACTRRCSSLPTQGGQALLLWSCS